MFLLKLVFKYFKKASNNTFIGSESWLDMFLGLKEKKKLTTEVSQHFSNIMDWFEDSVVN